MTGKTDLILGYAYGTGDVTTFLSSLRNLQPTTAVVLFATRLPEPTLAACEGAGVQLLPFVSASTTPRAQRSRAWRLTLEGGLTLRRWFAPPNHPADDDAIAVAKIALHPNQSRFLHYRDFLLEQGRHYRRIFMTDVRDVIFQRDPFDFSTDAPLLAFCEEKVNRIGTDKYNRRFILDAFGRRTLHDLREQVVICAGTIAGGRTAVLRYLDVFCDFTFRHAFKPGADQAIHNVIIRRGLVPAQIYPNREGFVLTLDRVPENELCTDGAHRLLNGTGAPFAVLHMFDRVPAANAAVRTQLNLRPTDPR